MSYSAVLFIAFLVASNAAPTGDFARNSGRFSLNLYKHVVGSSDRNVVISPLSIQTALAFVYMGADGETAQEMAAVMNFGNEASVTANNHKSLLENYATSSTVKIANRIYLDKTFRVKPTFLQVASDKFYSSAENLDFSDAESAAYTMNRWVESKTNNKIRNLVPIDMVQNSRTILINAVHFKADWAQKFPEYSTHQKDFWTSLRQSKKVDMMSQTSNFHYADFDIFKAARLLYKDSDLSMLVVLPNQRDGLKALEARFFEDGADVRTLLGQLREQLVHLELPKFKTEFEVGLVPTLSQMGMEKMFSNSADFSKLSNEKLKVGSVIHKAVIEVDEKGTEAAAATVVGLASYSASSYRPMPKQFIADHPFLYLLVNSEGHIFFMGRYVN